MGAIHGLSYFVEYKKALNLDIFVFICQYICSFMFSEIAIKRQLPLNLPLRLALHLVSSTTHIAS